MEAVAGAVLMVRPRAFGFAADAAATNGFQRSGGRAGEGGEYADEQARIAARARREADGVAEALIAAGVRVVMVEDREAPACADAVFPNNWLGLHPGGRAILYPMAVPSRRLERRRDVLERVREVHQTREVVDLSYLEGQGYFVEGTGSLVLDHARRRAYACLSPRTTAPGVRAACEALGYEPIFFRARLDGVPVYHTNVMLSVGPGVAVVADGLVGGEGEARGGARRGAARVELGSNWGEGGVELGSILRRGAAGGGERGVERGSDLELEMGSTSEDACDSNELLRLLSNQGEVSVIRLSAEQVRAFAGNVLWLRGRGGVVCLMSRRAEEALSRDQLSRIGPRCAVDIPTIEEIGGGSARCMVTEIFSPTDMERP